MAREKITQNRKGIKLKCLKKLGEDESGFHSYLEVKGDKREYHSYNNQVSTGYYESFIWEKGKGLINYRSGYGAESNSIELQLINN